MIPAPMYQNSSFQFFYQWNLYLLKVFLKVKKMRPIILIESLCIDLVRVKCRNISETKAQSNIAVDKLDKTANPSNSDRRLVDGEAL